MNIAAVSKPCSCANCKGDPQRIQLSGAALEAVHVYEDTLKRLAAEKKAARKAMWNAIHAGTGTEHLADVEAGLSVNTEFLSIGIAVLVIPAGLPLTAPQQNDAQKLVEAVEPAPEQPVATAA